MSRYVKSTASGFVDSSQPRFPATTPLNLLAIVVAISTAGVFYGGVRAFYFGSEFLAPIAYITDESISASLVAPVIGLPVEALLLGNHFFFDFFISYYWGGLPNPWFDNQLVFDPNHAPLAMLLGRAWGALEYGLARDLNVVLMAVSTVAVGLISLRRQRWALVVVGSCILLVSGPSIGALDRGNYQGYVPILMFAFAMLALRGRWGWAAVFVVTAASLKMYPIVLVLVFIAEKKWKPLAGVIVGGAIANLLLLFAFQGSPWRSGIEFFRNASLILGQEELGMMVYNTSFTGGLLHWSQLLGLETLLSLGWTYPWIVALVGIFLLTPLIWLRSRLPLAIRIIAALMLTTTMTTHSFPYTLNWSIAAAGVMFALSAAQVTPHAPSRHTPLYVWTTVVAVGLALSFVPVFIPGTMEMGFPAGASSLLSPVSVLVFSLGAYISAFRTSSNNAAVDHVKDSSVVRD